MFHQGTSSSPCLLYSNQCPGRVKLGIRPSEIIVRIWVDEESHGTMLSGCFWGRYLFQNPVLDNSLTTLGIFSNEFSSQNINTLIQRGNKRTKKCRRVLCTHIFHNVVNPISSTIPKSSPILWAQFQPSPNGRWIQFPWSFSAATIVWRKGI